MKKYAKILSTIMALSLVLFIGACDDGGHNQSTASSSQSQPYTNTPVTPKATAPAKTEAQSINPPWEMNWPPGLDDDNVKLTNNWNDTNFVVVLDLSGSMNDPESTGKYNSKLDAAQAILAKFSTETVPADANLALHTFSGRIIKRVVGLNKNNRDEFVSKLNKLVADNGTALSAAIEHAYEESILPQARKQAGYGTYIMVVVTDGEASAGYDPTDIVKELGGNTPVEIHVIGFGKGAGSNHSLNMPGYTIFTSARTPEEMEKGLSKVRVETDTFDPTSFNALKLD